MRLFLGAQGLIGVWTGHHGQGVEGSGIKGNHGNGQENQPGLGRRHCLKYGDDGLIQVTGFGIDAHQVQFSVHLQSQSVIAQDDKGCKGTWEPEEITSQHSLSDGPSLTDGADEKWSGNTPYHPVGPVKDSPVLGKGGGAHGIGPGGHAHEVLYHVPHSGDACLDDIAGLAPAQKEIGQQSEEQVNAGGCQFCNALHAEVYGHGIYHADDDQDSDGQEIVFRYAQHTA